MHRLAKVVGGNRGPMGTLYKGPVERMARRGKIARREIKMY
jgi:hypothetical protein